MITKNDKKIKIKARYVTKRFDLISTKSGESRIKKAFFPANKQDFWALRNVSFELYDGETIGIVGLNGSGKSTLSNIISGQISPTTGQVEINGDVSIISASSGLNGNLTGRENIRLKGLMSGMSKREIEEKMEDIIAFSELKEFIDQRVKTYSSGMRAKLGFSVMVHQDPDIMVIDEGLATGDQTFVGKSQKKMFEFREKGKTILLVSHSISTVRSWSDKVLWLHYGAVKEYGPVDEVLPKYEAFIHWFNGLDRKQQEDYKTKVRQEQLAYSLEEYKKELGRSETRETRKGKNNLKKFTSKAIKKKSSLPTKVLLFFFGFLFIWLVLVNTSKATLMTSLKNPIGFFGNHLFQPKQSFLERQREQGNLPPEPPQEDKAQEEAVQEEADKKTDENENSQNEEEKTEESTPRLVEYSIQAGDTLDAIALRFHTSVEELIRLNHAQDLSVLMVGQIIQVPENQASGESETALTEYTVQAGDTLESIALQFHTSVEELVRLNQGQDLSLLMANQVIKVPGN
ncbi:MULTISPECIES: LysM peptidoglycan-binding domain-containing protein [Lactococcus]|uniref:LysM peptidoglycan-binding domain-containing protein n=1 Tax=Lactococcus TaxID=1357 RepID=UPI00203E3C79|nr:MULTISPECIES: LysM peptidoglycan-binding domain-containing protein [Lactococcus]